MSETLSRHRRSFMITVIAAGAVAVLGLCVALAGAVIVPPYVRESPAWATASVVISLVALGVGAWAALITAGGMIALHRDALESAGRPYVPSRPRESTSGRFLGPLLSRLRFGRSDHDLGLRAGETVEIKSLDEILATLDANGTLDGLPFMPEMAAYCGQTATVFRRVDKIHDWLGRTGLRRVRTTVQLTGLRCDGSMHGGCQAECHLRWKEAWVRRSSARKGSERTGTRDRAGIEMLVQLSRRAADDGTTRYVCQSTELNKCTEPIGWANPGTYLRDLATGNVRLGPWLTGISIVCFNWVQQKRGSVGFPYFVPTSSKTSPSAYLGLQTGELVRVKSKARIEETLNAKGRNRGLWFDQETLQFCGGEFRVIKVVNRAMIESTGMLRELTTPCVILEGVVANGEYRSFNPENDYIFWREIWLERVNPAPGAEELRPVELVQRD